MVSDSERHQHHMLLQSFPKLQFIQLNLHPSHLENQNKIDDLVSSNINISIVVVIFISNQSRLICTRESTFFLLYSCSSSDKDPLIPICGSVLWTLHSYWIRLLLAGVRKIQRSQFNLTPTTALLVRETCFGNFSNHHHHHHSHPDAVCQRHSFAASAYANNYPTRNNSFRPVSQLTSLFADQLDKHVSVHHRMPGPLLFLQRREDEKNPVN